MPLGFPITLSEQTHTAARPSRLWTAFPFIHPKAHTFGPAVKLFLCQRALLPYLYQTTRISSRKNL